LLDIARLCLFFAIYLRKMVHISTTQGYHRGMGERKIALLDPYSSIAP
jgi:hypothetical protein